MDSPASSFLLATVIQRWGLKTQSFLKLHGSARQVLDSRSSGCKCGWCGFTTSLDFEPTIPANVSEITGAPGGLCLLPVKPRVTLGISNKAYSLLRSVSLLWSLVHSFHSRWALFEKRSPTSPHPNLLHPEPVSTSESRYLGNTGWMADARLSRQH